MTWCVSTMCDQSLCRLVTGRQPPSSDVWVPKSRSVRLSSPSRRHLTLELSNAPPTSAYTSTLQERRSVRTDSSTRVDWRQNRWTLPRLRCTSALSWNWRVTYSWLRKPWWHWRRHHTSTSDGHRSLLTTAVIAAAAALMLPLVCLPQVNNLSMVTRRALRCLNEVAYFVFICSCRLWCGTLP